MARKFKSMNTTGTTVKTGRHDSENSTRKVNDFSYRRNNDYCKKKEDVGRFFRCRECERFGHYQAECPTFLRRQKKNYYATLSDEDSDDAEVDHGMNAFTTCITDINLDDDSECSDNDKDEDLTLEKLKMLRKKDSEARAIQKERIQDLMEENERLMGVISSLKVKLKENGSSKYGLGFNASMGSAKFTSKVRFVPASVKAITNTTAITNTSAKSSRWICYYCGRKDHIRSFCYKLLRDMRYQQKAKFENHQNNSIFAKCNRSIRGTHMVWRVKTSKNCKITFTTVQTTNDAWYFDSGCSRHMTGNRSFFIGSEECASDHVTFRDGAKGRIIAKGTIDKSNLPCLNDVRYVDGLKANLISIS
ncbi:gag-pol polyprotein [Cucumis melo var. makuwa]|uniref:Gag-pol polyprotein n=1 Tax=Cucumis melo var. makuwa TaxID=1194695 RepID=A0A5D3C4B4_CUCMM|nr:gag-pol polyprotein [Cucumis melo var. makuwa]